MIYIIVANMYEAKPFIHKYRMEKEESQDFIEVYRKENRMLLITRAGLVPAAISVTHFLSQRRPSTSDIIINVGLCATLKNGFADGSMFLCYKIYESESNRKFFPDFLFPHPFSEAGVTSVNLPFVMIGDAINEKNYETELIDTEASAIFQSVMATSKTHNVYFFKIVSGHGGRGKINPILGERLVAAHMDEIMDWASEINAKCPKEYDFTPDEIRLIKNLSKYLILSPVKEQELLQYLYYYKTEQNDVISFLLDYKDTLRGKDIFTREEGKRCYDELFGKINFVTGGKEE